jgi:hypothetical protein
MKKYRNTIPLLALGLCAHSAFGQTSFAGYDWFDGSDATVVTDGNLVSTTGSSSSTWTVYFAPEESPATLAEAGDKLVIVWKFKMSGVNVSNTSQNFRIGVMDSPAETRVTMNNAPVEGAYTGYAMFGNLGQVTDNSGAFQIRERNGTGGTLGTSSLWTAQDSGMGKAVLGYADDIEYTFTASIERTANGSAKVDFSMVGGSINDTGSVSVSFLDGSPQPFTYDTFMIRPSNASTTANTFTTTSFTVTAPEGTGNGGGETKGPGIFSDYDMTADGWVSTANWMGWVNTVRYPWVFSAAFNQYIYIPEGGGASGTWAYIPR